MGTLGYYVFETEQEALDAEKDICIIADLPIIGVDAINKQLQPNRTKTEIYATPKQRLDGKWVFERVPIEIAHTYPQEVLQEFANKHKYTIEPYSDEWFLNE